MIFRHFLQFAGIDQTAKLLEMEHRSVLAMFAVESNILAEIHVLQMIRDETAITPLYPFAELPQYDFIHICLSVMGFNTRGDTYLITPRADDSMNSTR